MESWMALGTDALWRNAVAVIPLALLVAAICRFTRCRPATRHALWTLVLLWLMLPPVMPGLTFQSLLGSTNASDPDRSVTDTQSEPRLPASWESAAMGTVPTPPGTAARAEARPPERLALAAGKAERLFSFDHQDSSHATSGASRSDTGDDRADPRRGGLDSATGHSGHPGPASTSASENDVATASSAVGSSGDVRVASVGRAPESRGAGSALSRGGSESSNGPVPSRLRRLWAAVTAPLTRWVSAVLSVRDAIGGIPSMPVGVWLLGTVLFAIVMTCRTVRFVRRIRDGRAAPADVRRCVARAARALGLRRVPETIMVRESVSPLVWCGRRPKLILPSGLWSQLDSVGREAVLVHELAHLRRRDHWVRWAELIVSCVYWWHPVVWWARRRLHEEADLCCDAWVTWLRPRGRRAYAEALMVTKSFISEDHVPVPAVGMGVTSARARRFAGRLTMVMTQSLAPRLSVSGVVAALTLALAGWVATPAPACPPKSKAKTAPKVLLKSIDVPTGPIGLAGDVVVVSQPLVSVSGVAGAAVVAPSDDTYRAHLATRSGLVGGVAMPGPSLVGAVQPATLGFATLAGPPDDLERRLERLERQNAELNKKLDRLANALERVGASGRGRNAPAARSAPSATGARRGRAPREPRAPRTPRATAGRRGMLVQPLVPNPVQPPAAPGRDELIARSYRLPKGQLKDLTELMIRADVPVLVSPHDDHIEVHATEAHHRIFKAFVNMIHPTGSRSGGRGIGAGRSGAGPRPQPADAPRRSRGSALRGARRSAEQADQAAQEARRADEIAAQAMARAAEFETQIAALLNQMRALESQAEAVEEQAEEIEEQAEELSERAEEIAEKAEQTEDKNEARAMKAEAKELARHARNMLKQAKKMEREAEKLERKAAKMEDRVDSLRAETKAARR